MNHILPQGVALQFKNLTLGYERHPAVHHLQGVVYDGDLLAIVGPNGAGKSTLLKSIAGLLRPLQGSIVRRFPQRVQTAYLPQISEIDREFPIDVFDFVTLGAMGRLGLFHRLSSHDQALVIEAMHDVGLSGFEQRALNTLSGGQMQRALFARMMVQNAPLLLLDEPFNAVDERSQQDLMELIRRWHGQGRTIIAVLHDMELVRRNFPKTLLLARELVAWGVTDQVLSEENIARSKALCEAFDMHAIPCAEIG